MPRPANSVVETGRFVAGPHMPRMSKLGAHRSSRDVPGAAFAFFVDLKLVHLSCAVCAAANDAPCGTSSIAGKGSSASPVSRPPTGFGTSVNGSGKLPVLSRQAQLPPQSANAQTQELARAHPQAGRCPGLIASASGCVHLLSHFRWVDVAMTGELRFRPARTLVTTRPQ